MLGDSVADFPREIQPAAIVPQDIHDAQALLVVLEAAGSQLVEDTLAGVAEGRVAEIVAERDGLGQLLVEVQHLRDRAGDLGDLQRVREPRAVVIARRREEDLRLVLQPAERLGVDDAIAIPLERRADVVLGLRPGTATAVGGPGRLRRENLAFTRLELLANQGHRRRTPQRAGRKLVPWPSAPTPKLSATVWPRSANVSRVPSAVPTATSGPVTSSGTCSREWSVLGVVGSLP